MKLFSPPLTYTERVGATAITVAVSLTLALVAVFAWPCTAL